MAPPPVKPPSSSLSKVDIGTSKVFWNGDDVKTGFEIGRAVCHDDVECTASSEVRPGLGRHNSVALHLHAKKIHNALLGFNWSSTDGTSAVDSTPFNALAFWVRWKTKAPNNAIPTGAITVTLHSPGAINHIGAVEPCTEPAADGQWHRVLMPMTGKRGNGSGFDPARIIGISFCVADSVPQDFDIDVDDVSFENLSDEGLQQLCQLDGPPIEDSKRKVLWNGDTGKNARLGNGWASCQDPGSCNASVAQEPAVGTNFNNAVHFAVDGRGIVPLGWAWNGILSRRGSDISRFDILTFRMRVQSGSPEQAPLPGRFTVSLAGKHSRYSRSVLLEFCTPNFTDGQWHDIRIPLRELYDGTGKDFDPTQALSLLLTPSALDRRKFDLYVDDIAVEEARPEDENHTCLPPKIDVEAVAPLSTYTCTEADAHPAPVDVIPKGQLSPSLVSRTLSDFGSGVNSAPNKCIGSAMQQNPRLVGKVTIKFSVAPDGKVLEATPVCTSLPAPKTVDCLRDAVLGLSFPASALGAKSQRMTWRVVP